MNLADISETVIETWTTEQLCAALIESKKIISKSEFIKELLRTTCRQGEKIKVSNGSVTVKKPNILLAYDEAFVNSEFLLDPIKPLDRKKVKAFLIANDGNVPRGVSVNYSKPIISVKVD